MVLLEFLVFNFIMGISAFGRSFRVVPNTRRFVHVNFLVFLFRRQIFNRLTCRIFRRFLTSILIQRIFPRAIRFILRRRISINFRRCLFKLRTRSKARYFVMNFRGVRRVCPMVNARSFLLRYNFEFCAKRRRVFISPFRYVICL